MVLAHERRGTHTRSRISLSLSLDGSSRTGSKFWAWIESSGNQVRSALGTIPFILFDWKERGREVWCKSEEEKGVWPRRKDERLNRVGFVGLCLRFDSEHFGSH